MSDITANLVIGMPAQLFTLARSYKANANGKIYIGQPDTDPTNPANQIQVYVENEDGSHIPVPQPIIINAGGFPVFGGQIKKFVTVQNYSMAIYDAYNAQQFYFKDVAKYDPDQLRQQIEDPEGAGKYPSLQMARWRDEHDIRGWGAKTGIDASQAAKDAIDSGIESLFIPEGEWIFNSGIQLPARDFTLYGVGRGSILKGAATELIKYPASVLGCQNVHSLKFIAGANQTAIQMHKIWDANGKEESQITRCHFRTIDAGAKFITVQGIWSGRIQDNEFYGGSKSNDTYGVMFITADNMNSSAMNIDINNNKYVLVAYPVYYAGRTITSGGRLEGISVNNNKSIGSKIGVRFSSTLATIINGNLLHDCDSSAIELNGDFDFVISGNAELWGSVQAILIQGTTGSIPERGVVSGNKINAGNGINGVVLRTNVTTPRSISITGNMIGRQASGALTGAGVKVDSTANVNNVTITGNTFQQLDTAIDRGGQAGDIVVGSNSYVFVTNIGAGMKSTPYTNSLVITLVGGATSEKINIDLPAGMTNKKPQFAIVLGTGLTSNDSLVGFYDFVNSTATQLKFTLYRMDGAAITASTSIRLQVMANLF
ncbi:phage head-binding domain-containing protein [Escherichia coli]